MPLRDGTGPMGMGTMTGKREGYCTGQNVPAYAGRSFGFGFGRGRGRCRYNRPYFEADMTRFSAPSQEEERQLLKKEADALQSHLNEVKRRLDELDSRSYSVGNSAPEK